MIYVHVVSSVLNGGVASVVREMLRQQNADGIAAAVISQDAPEQVEQMKERTGLVFDFYPVNALRRRFGTVSGLLSRRRRRSFSDPDGVFVHYHNAIACGLFGFLDRNGVCTLHGRIVSPSRISRGVLLSTLRRAYRKGIRMVGCSRDTASFYEELLGFSLKTVHNGICPVAPAEDRYGLSGRFNILYDSTLDELKGWRYLRDAYLSLDGELREKCALIVCATGSEEEMAALRELASREPDIRYLGYVEDLREAVVPYCHTTVLPSRTEGLPMTLLEFCAVSRPMIATAVGGIPEVLTDGETGFVCERTVDSVRGCLIRMIEAPDLYAAMGAAAGARYEAEFTAAKTVEQYQKIMIDGKKKK